MSPFVVAPQTKKLAVSSQNVDVRDAVTRPPIAARNGFCWRDRRVVDDGAEGAEADVGRAVAEEEGDERQA